MKKKSKVLLTSAASIAMCASMIAGGTYALFSSESEVNIAVTSGKVAIKAIVDKASLNTYSYGGYKYTAEEVKADSETTTESGSTWVSSWYNGGYAQVVDANVALNLITPGDGVNFDIKITNESNINIQYTVSLFAKADEDNDEVDDLHLLNGLSVTMMNEAGEAKLFTATEAGEENALLWSDWCQLSPADGTDVETISLNIELPINAGNEYQDMGIELVCRIQAVQSNGAPVRVLNENEVGISNAEELFAFAKAVNDGNTYAGKTVYLLNDIDLANVAWTPIGLYADGTNKFKGTFDGLGHTISNLSVDTTKETERRCAGFFGVLNGTVKNFNIRNASVKGLSTVDNDGAAVVAGSIYAGGTIENVHVYNAMISGNHYVGGISGYAYGSIKNCSVMDATIECNPNLNSNGKYDNGDKAGAIAGYFSKETKNVVTANIIKNVTVKAYRDFGGVVGTANGAGAVTNNKLSNVTIISNRANYEADYVEAKALNVDKIVGRITNGVLDDSNTSNNVTLPKFSMDGVEYNTLAAAMAAVNDSNASEVNLDLEGAVVTWQTGASHGSTKLVDNSDVETVTFDGGVSGATFIAEGSGVGAIAATGATKLVFNNVTFVDNSTSYAESAWEFTYLEMGGEIEFKNCTFKCGVQIDSDDARTSNAKFVDCTFEANEPKVYALWVSEGTVSIDNCYFTGTRALKVHEEYGSEVSSVIVNNSTFKDISEKPGVALGTLNTETTIAITGCTFINCAKSSGDVSAPAYDYMVETDTDLSNINFTFTDNNMH